MIEPLGAVWGLSPRTRGSREIRLCQRRRQGPIPADAGEPPTRHIRGWLMRAYPRGRGGAEAIQEALSLFEGLSPRTRGSRVSRHGRGHYSGPIPADAGEPSPARRPGAGSRAYPRGRGGAAATCVQASVSRGLSPRTRGSHRAGSERLSDRGPIPADAGEPNRVMTSPDGITAYPRGRGGAIARRTYFSQIQGLSPRTRGSLPDHPGFAARVGPIPADAGEPWTGACAANPSRAYPRGRGGAVSAGLLPGGCAGLSPRTRGSLDAQNAPAVARGPIPADAGEPPWLRCLPRTRRAYPRGRGGAPITTSCAGSYQGLSPRTRGSLATAPCPNHLCGPIPADAGEPQSS